MVSKENNVQKWHNLKMALTVSVKALENGAVSLQIQREVQNFFSLLIRNNFYHIPIKISQEKLPIMLSTNYSTKPYKDDCNSQHKQIQKFL